MDSLIGIIAFVLVLSAIVAIHEFGHLIAAKFYNVYCAEFAIGMGPLVYQKKGKETVYSIRALPIGGYVAMAGETEQQNDIFPTDLPKERMITGLNPWKRMVVQLAGIFMNLVLGFVIFTIVFSMWGSPSEASTYVASVMTDSPAQVAGFKVGDEIIELVVNDRLITVESYDYMTLSSEEESLERIYTVLRDDETVKLTVTPTFDEASQRYLVGVSFGAKALNFFEAIQAGFSYTIESMLLIFTVIRQLFVGQGLENLSGPVGIYTATSQVAAQGFVPLLYFTGILSVNVGVLQLLPLPALDGGRVVFSLWEAITGKPVNQKLETMLIVGSFVLLFLLIILVTFKDIITLL